MKMQPGAIAIVHDNEYNILLQHRDNIPNIFWPDYWGLWGGGIEGEETPEQAVLRELKEEISWDAPKPNYISQDVSEYGHDFYVFSILLNVPLTALKLLEGAEMRMFSADEIETLKMVPHHKTHLLSFLSLKPKK